jgi:ABC transport system ATP-binding/permease protein
VLKLIIEDDEGRKTVVPFVRDEITIGRQEGNTIRLTERNVSRRHARLVRQNGHVIIEDLHSSYGIRVNGDRIAGQVQVGDGDLIQIGDYDLAIQAEAQPAATVPMDETHPGLGGGVSATQPLLPSVGDLPQAADEDVQEAPLGDEETTESAKQQSTAVIRADLVESNRKRSLVDIDAADAPRLVVLNTDLAGREFPCTRSELKIGRTDDNDIAIDHRSLSRTHCKVVREDSGEWRVIDLQSANGLMVNGEPYAQVTLRPGDILELGHVKLQFVAAGEAATAPAITSVTQETRRVASRAPVYAVAGALAVIIVGVGGYGLFKSRASGAVEAPPRAPPEAPSTRAAELEAARRAAAQKVAQARSAIEALDWVKAESLLRESRLDADTLTPEAQGLLSQLDAERGARSLLEDAARLLDRGEDEKARPLLEGASSTQLLAVRYRELEGRRAKLAAERLAKKGPAPTPSPAQPPPAQPVAAAPQPAPSPAVAAALPRTDPGRSKTDDAEALYQEARELLKAQQLEAAVVRLDKCVKIAPMYYPCYKYLGSAHAKMGSRESNEAVASAERAKARKYYERFVELAPPDDKDVPKVKGILDPGSAENPK